jgi:hypothetical protein
MAIEPVRDVVESRLLTFTDIKGDYSYQSRVDGYGQLLSYLSSIPFGLGLGSMDAKFSGKADIGPRFSSDISIGGRDSGILEILFSLGWGAGAIYLTALLLLGLFLINVNRPLTEFQTFTAAISVAVMTQLFLGSATTGFPGLMLWGFAGISLGSRSHQNRQISDPAANQNYRVQNANN